MVLISSDEDRYGFTRFPVSARVLPYPLSGLALASLLAPSSAITFTSRKQTQDGPPSSQAPHPT
ncbi:MAG: hypothetical protein ACXWPG_13395 [Ktedonobacteraceae bacterium]